jgi:single-strand DNA-binding protein
MIMDANKTNANTLDANNIVLLRGTLTNDPVYRSLPSGGTVTQLELTTRVAGRATSVPVVVYGESIGVVGGDAVVVTGHVSRRFFRAGGVTQSRTEVVAVEVIKATRKRTIERVVEGLVDLLTAA